jgi:hypothetical protein
MTAQSAALGCSRLEVQGFNARNFVSGNSLPIGWGEGVRRTGEGYVNDPREARAGPRLAIREASFRLPRNDPFVNGVLAAFIPAILLGDGLNLHRLGAAHVEVVRHDA